MKRKGERRLPPPPFLFSPVAVVVGVVKEIWSSSPRPYSSPFYMKRRTTPLEQARRRPFLFPFPSPNPATARLSTKFAGSTGSPAVVPPFLSPLLFFFFPPRAPARG